MNNQMRFDAMGWLGATALLFAYAMVSSRKMETDSARYQFPEHRWQPSPGRKHNLLSSLSFFLCELDLGRDSCFVDHNATASSFSGYCYERLKWSACAR